ncbi:MAG: hypothetical protein L0H96_20890 [Humibacillus sp.]|nr:hypothetical protein [Humibacillus sp.]MDN5779354.1 hypothetical protein [Humibacillus sp.]
MFSTRNRPTLPRWRRARSGAVALGVVALTAPVMAVATTSTASASPTAARAASPYCGIVWGSLPKTSSPSTRGLVAGLRSGQHPCYDRLVFDIGDGSGTVGYDVRYVDKVTNPASGVTVPVAGGARLQITIHAPATKQYPAGGSTTFNGWSTFRQVKWVSSFEGYTDVGLGVRARLPMRVFTLPHAAGGQRLVVDVAHRW